MSKNTLDRELSKAEQAQIVGFYRQSHDVLSVALILEISVFLVELILNRHFGNKLLNYK